MGKLSYVLHAHSTDSVRTRIKTCLQRLCSDQTVKPQVRYMQIPLNDGPQNFLLYILRMIELVHMPGVDISAIFRDVPNWSSDILKKYKKFL